ncbi:Cellobiose-specific phosphotransferase enzyme IIB component [Tepidanaerobacter acetatoxydans Re1]|uniref:Cellobiose-specific phosphotransferase enzyme IIB component n=1 Tax=Tepidanaerobacter acetatoxydans (strain DSM 21804 / JCM 16047 / Re1) TaxID=1209989 RepID=F4LXR4_TEPAE|nr:PTS sugar transporter subunit IIB [Tepidanaerobacter acetatoxydans]AEE91993.1 phosphotransferase system lactose/cellobiose-specific IIB subunit [Tepidanaerobacter acetatoxydans Re1]CCP26832.1 Cellobiose-specific phosphotransferase enzyme IIB component [Tepidanaerobacter acetatoxydans Re1]
MKILLVCAGGMSTSLIVEKMKREIEKRKIEDIKVDANTIEELEQVIDDYDIVMVGPQIRYKEPYIKSLCAQRGKKYTIIPPAIYGAVDSAKILDLAINLINN